MRSVSSLRPNRLSLLWDRQRYQRTTPALTAQLVVNVNFDGFVPRLIRAYEKQSKGINNCMAVVPLIWILSVQLIEALGYITHKTRIYSRRPGNRSS